MNDRSWEFICAGASHVDHVGRFAGEAVPGASNPGRMRQFAGGAAANVASILAALGRDALLATPQAADANGVWLGALHRQRHLALCELHRIERTPSYTAILDRDGEPVAALADMGAYDTIPASAADIVLQKAAGARWLLVDTNLPVPLLDALVRKAPCPVAAMAVSPAKAVRLVKLGRWPDVIFANGREWRAIRRAYEKAASKARFVVSDGARAIRVIDHGSETDIPIVPTERPRDATGAGDALAAGTLAGLASGVGLHDAVAAATPIARSIVEVDGPYRPDLPAIALYPATSGNTA